MSNENQSGINPGIRSALRKIAETEGPKAALTTAYRWQAALEEIYAVACPTMHTLRPGGPQKLCAAVLLMAVSSHIKDNPLAAPPVEDPTPDDEGKGV